MARYSIFVHHISNRARVQCKRHINHQPMRCLWVQNHMKIQRMQALSKPSAKSLRTAKYSRHNAKAENRPTAPTKKCWFYNFYSSSRMITIDHMYALHHCCQHNLHVMSLPQIQITTHLHESGPKAPTCPSSITTLILLSGLRNFSHNHPGGELNKTEGTSSVQVPSLSYSREQNHTGGLKPFSRSDMPLWHCRPKYHLA